VEVTSPPDTCNRRPQRQVHLQQGACRLAPGTLPFECGGQGRGGAATFNSYEVALVSSAHGQREN